MKMYKWIGPIIGAALLQTASSENLALAIAQETTVAGQPGEMMPPAISPATAEVTRLAASGVSEEVQLAFIKRSSSRFGLSEKAIVYLKDLGLTQEVIAAMLERDSQLSADLPPGPTAEMTSGPDPVGTAEQPAAPYETNAPADVNYFYAQLSPYGTWASIEGVGWCWQPHCCAFSIGWRPYCHGGHWLYTDCGWYWQSDYSWGWAPFHYGRWHHHERYGWVWCPDRQWGPAWVTWRVNGHHCGWAPLPPNSIYVTGQGWRHRGIYQKDDCDFDLKPHHFTFVAMKDFTSHELGRQRLPDIETHNFYNNTTIVNSRMVANNLVNQGVHVEKIAAMTHSEIPKIAIRDIPATSDRMHGIQRGEANGSVIYRHELQVPAQPLTVVAQKLDNNHPAVTHSPIPARPLQQAQQPPHKTPATQHPAKSPGDQPNNQKAR
jgi:hypothetical protein